MPLVVFSNENARYLDEKYITVDVQGRIYLSRETRRMLSCEGQSIKLYLAYDKVNKRIGLAKPDIVRLTNVKPFRFSGKRAYASARSFLKANNLIPAKKADRYIYDGKEGDWYTFKLEGYDAPDEKNIEKL